MIRSSRISNKNIMLHQRKNYKNTIPSIQIFETFWVFTKFIYV